MQTRVAVPLNTMLADLDEALKALLRRELGQHGFDGVEIAFEAPDKEWSAALSGPTVNLFLYELKESEKHRAIDWYPEPHLNGELRPPLRVDASYAVTAWTRVVQDEHRLLSQILAILYAFPELPAEVLNGTLRLDAGSNVLASRVAQGRADGAADFWAAVGGPYKASIDYVVTLACEPGAVLERGPEVRTATVRVRQDNGARGSVEETHHLGGVVRDGDGAPVEDAWVTLVEQGLLATSDAEGRFRFGRVRAGGYHVRARGPAGEEAEVSVEVPRGQAELTLGARPAGRRARK